MKRLLLAAALILAPSLASAQCSGVFPATTICGNPSGSNAAPSARPVSAFIAGIINVAAPITFNSGTGVIGLSTPLALQYGGTAANLTASNGGLVYSTGAALAILSGTATAGQIPRSGASGAPSWSTATYPATAAQGTVLNATSANVIAATIGPLLGVAGSTKGTIGLSGNTSGVATIQPQAVAGTPTLTLPNTSGTFAVTATAPIVLSATTGDLTCPTCFLTSGGAALTRVDDTNITLTLGGSASTALVNAASITAGWTGTLAAARLNANVPQSIVNDTNVTGSIAAQALTLGWTGTASVARGGTASATAIAARSSTGLNVESYTGHGDSNYIILVTDKVVGTTATLTTSRTWTLPAASAVNGGQPVVVSDFFGGVTATETLIVQRAGADTVNGGTSVTINSANGAYLLWSDGVSKWTAQAIGGTGISGVANVGGLTGAVGVTNGIEVSGANIQISAARRTLPSIQSFTSGSGTYTTPANVLWIDILMVGAGGGGSGGTTNGGNGGDTCWKATATPCTTPLYQAGGGAGSAGAGAGGIGGVIAGSGSCTVLSIAGGDGQGSSTLANVGGQGGSSSLGGAARGAVAAGNNNGAAGKTNTGGGGGGGTQAAASFQGGGAGATCRTIITTPGASYTYTVGAAGAAGTGTGAGGAGGSGLIVVVEHYGS